jgi:hypothetical protein
MWFTKLCNGIGGLKKETWFGWQKPENTVKEDPLNIRVEKRSLGRSEETSSATESFRHGTESHMR